jgi:DNA invertase Pin-like site-specific DNA recombinase
VQKIIMSEKIKPHHLERKAILYVRQSSAYQVTHNLESQNLQYAMQKRLHQLGWREVEVVDDDLGRSAAGTVTRAGFERMVAEVCFGRVGAVAAREVSRFARNSREWQQLVEVCRIVDTVLIDQETVYAPRQSNDRLLLGLKGSLNEYELDLLRQRSVEARYEKARRGELVITAPVGYIKTDEQKLEKNPDRRVQEAICLVFRKFRELGTVRQTLLWFLEHELQLPSQTARGELFWRRPSYRSVYRLITNPVYGGAYTYGKTEQVVRYVAGKAHHCSRRKAREQWLALIPHAHEGYISWEESEQIRRAVRENTLSAEQPGAAKQGAGLLTGLLRCQRCGRKLTIRYTGSQHEVLRYTCNRGWLDHGEPRCIAFGGVPVDDAIGRQVLAAVQPAAIEAALLASEEQMQEHDDAMAALQRDLEAARYAAQRAQRQYDAADPENRLVTGELERRWNQALQRVNDIENRIHCHAAEEQCTATATPEEFTNLAEKLDLVWNDPRTDARLKKRIVRTLIQEVVADVDSGGGEVILVIHWKGGLHTEVRVPRRRRGYNNAHTDKGLVEAVSLLANICNDEFIAGVLNRNGHRTGRGNRWTKERVTALRSYHHIPRYDPENKEADGWMNLSEAAAFLNVSARTLRLAVEAGELRAEHPLSDGPWLFERGELISPAAEPVKQRARNSSRRSAVPVEDQRDLQFSST